MILAALSLRAVMCYVSPTSRMHLNLKPLSDIFRARSGCGRTRSTSIILRLTIFALFASMTPSNSTAIEYLATDSLKLVKDYSTAFFTVAFRSMLAALVARPVIGFSSDADCGRHG